MRIWVIAMVLLLSMSYMVVTDSDSPAVHDAAAPAVHLARGVNSSAFSLNGSFPHHARAQSLFSHLKLTSSAVGDVNGDLFPDAIFASYGAGDVAVYLNSNGTLNMTPALIIGSSDGVFGPTYVSVVDSRIAVACHDSSSTGVDDKERVKLYNVTDPSAPLSLNPPTASTTTPITLVSLAVGDFNGDGMPDIAAAFSSYSPTGTNTSKIAIYYAPFSDGEAPSKTITLGNNISYMAAGDFNGDGRLDLSVITDDGAQVVVYYQNNGGGFNANEATYITTDGAKDILSYDLNEDGIADLAVANSRSGAISIFYGSTSGVPSSPSLSLSAGAGVRAIAAGDFNGDGRIDMLASRGDLATYTYDAPRWLELFAGPFSDGETATKRIFGGYGVLQLRAADFNLDGYPDVLSFASGAVGDRPSLPFVLYQSNGTLGPVSDELLYAGVHPHGLAMGDFNGDGHVDMAVAEPLANETAIFYNQGYGFSVLPDENITIYGQPYELAYGNFVYGVGIVATHLLDGNATLHIFSTNTDINLTTPMNSTLQVRVEDMNGDGAPDIVLTAANNSSAAVYVYLGGRGFHDGQAPNYTLNLTSAPEGLYVINLYGSRYPGLAILYSDAIEIYNQSAPGNFSLVQSIAPTTGYSFTSISTGDYNGDSYTDIVAFEYSSTLGLTRYGLLYQSSSGFGAPQATGSIRGIAATSISGDFNDDGFVDFAAAMNNGRVYVFYFNGTSFSSDYLPACLGPRTLVAGDLNDDGKEDLALSSIGTSVDSVPLEVGVVEVYYQRDFPPVANISAPESIYEGNNITLSGANSTDGVSDQATLNYTWYYLNGAQWDGIGYGMNVSYFAPSQGNYTFKLVVRDKEGLSNFTTCTVRVLDTVPVVNFTHTSAVEGQPVEFRAVIHAYDGIYKILWDMNGDGRWDFVNETVVNYTYPSQGNYSVNLTVIDGDGSVGYVNRTVEVADTAPNASFVYSPRVIYQGELVNFTSTSTSYDPMVNWTWNFGTGVVKYGPNTTYAFPNNGTYYVTLSVRDSDGSVSRVTEPVHVLDTAPEVNFTYTGKYEGQPFHFYANVTSQDPIASYFWDFGDGNYSHEENPVHVYAQNGTYLVTLYVNDSDGSNSSYSRLVVVEDTKPKVCFNYTGAVEGQPTHFYANITSYDGVVYIHWDFGDGNGSDERNPTHVYRENGVYTVTVVVKEADGDEANCTKQVYVKDTSPVVFLKLDTHGKIVEDEKIRLNASGTHAYDGIKKYFWDFTYYDGHFIADVATTAPYVETSYPERGNYTIALRVEDGDGSFTTAFLNITVYNVPPVANFTFTVNKNELVVNASSSHDTPSDLKTLNYTWHFGDGTVGYGMIAVHKYRKPGVYSVKLTVTDNDGAMSNITRVVKITEVPPSPGGGTHMPGGLPWFLWLLVIATALVAVAFFLALKKEKLTVDDVYLIDESGTLIYHATRRLKPDMDEDILSSMLVAIQEFVKDAFKGEEGASLKSMEFGNKKISIHKGKHLILATISSTKLSKKIEEKAAKILEEIEEKYRDVLANWDGDVSAFKGVGDILKKLWD